MKKIAYKSWLWVAVLGAAALGVAIVALFASGPTDAPAPENNALQTETEVDEPAQQSDESTDAAVADFEQFRVPTDDGAGFRALLDDPRERVREDAVEALAGIGDSSSVAGLGYAMSDESASVRRLAIEGLASIGSAEATNTLALALNEIDSSLRELAIDELAGIGTDNAYSILQEFLADPDSDVAELAAEYIAEDH